MFPYWSLSVNEQVRQSRKLLPSSACDEVCAFSRIRLQIDTQAAKLYGGFKNKSTRHRRLWYTKWLDLLFMSISPVCSRYGLIFVSVKSTGQDLSTPGSMSERSADRRDDKELPYLWTATRADSQLLLQRFQVFSLNARKTPSIGPMEGQHRQTSDSRIYTTDRIGCF